MTSFDARLHLIGQSGFALGVEVDLTGEQMTVTADRKPVAVWSLDDITIAERPDGFHIEAEGEEIILNVTEDALFAKEISLRKRPR